MRLFSKVHDVFRIGGRGTVVVFEEVQPGARLKARDAIQLRASDGQIIETHVISIEHLSGPKVKFHWGLLLPTEVGERNVPAGTEIWTTTPD